MEGRYEYGHYVAPNGVYYDSYKEYKEDMNMENINVNNVTVAAVENTTLKEDNTMTNITVAKLRKEAKKAGIVGYSRMKKAELINILSGTSTVKKDNKEELWDKLLLSMQRQYIVQSYEKTADSYKKKYKALFYRVEEEIKEEGNRAVYHIVARRLWAVTAMVIDKSYGKGTANESNVLQTVNKLLERGIISKLDNINKEWQTRYYATPQQMKKMFFTVHPKKEEVK